MIGRSRGAAVLALAACAIAPSAAFGQGFYSPDNSPAGANDFECVPSAEHPEPVVLVHGLGANMQGNWGYISPRLADAGYCVFALTYGRKADNPPPFDQNGGLIPMEESALELAAFVDQVLTATGATQVDIVGHSEGSLMPNHYVKFLPEARHADGSLKVDDYVGITPLWDGSNVGGVGTLREAANSNGSAEPFEQLVERGCEACTQVVSGSDFMDAMNAGPTGPRVEGVTYTMLMTRYDQLVIPYTSGHMDGATNIVMQDQCPADPSEHVAMAFNPNVLRNVLNALDPANAGAVDCSSMLRF
ncbi:MAG TPA: alpha/beta fold hydrolase [Thermoleophilaceae bacterium]|nr:alpha/beta fold hydrolase [Thermoleophilaceae bacterium]